MDLIAHTEGMGAEIRYVDHMDRWGRYDYQRSIVWLLKGMGVAQWRSTLAHEAGHVFWGHTHDGPRQERQADEHAVRLLVPLGTWARATAGGESVAAVAHDLLVVPRLVVVAHRLYQGYCCASG